MSSTVLQEGAISMTTEPALEQFDRMAVHVSSRPGRTY
jgi:hypothetical protein